MSTRATSRNRANHFAAYGWAVALSLALGAWGTGCDDKAGSGGGTPDMMVGGEGGGGAGGMGGGAGGGVGGGGSGGPCFDDTECAATEYCDLAEGATLGTCAQGCRLDACPEGEFCNAETRACEVERCERDSDCADGEYCGVDGCTPGCRTQPDSCEPQGGITFRCDEITRQCAPLVACCSEEGACSLGVANTCEGQVLPNTTTCANDPCGAICTDDTVSEVCEPDEYCNEDGRCERGCRLGAQDPDGANCPDGQICDPDSRTCEQIPCDGDALCPEGYYCDVDVANGSGVCAEGCRIGGDDCAVGLTCDANHVCRAFCNDDFPCPDEEAFYCDVEAEICRGRCVGHDDCLSVDEYCNVELGGRCQEGCRDDLDQEPNDDLASATLLPVVGGLAATYDRTLCPGTDDYYAVQIGEGARIRIALSFDQAVGDLQMALYGPEGELIETAAGLVSPESILWPAALDQGAPAGTYSVRVYGAADDVTNVYDLSVEVAGGDGGPACFLDAADLANPSDDLSENARIVGQAPRARFTEVYEGSICENDVDWFRFPVSPDDGLEVELVAAPGSTPAAVELFSPIRVNNVVNPNYRTDLEGGEILPDGSTRWTLILPADAGQFDDNLAWYLRVIGEGEVPVVDYRLTLTFIRAEPCPADISEPNDFVAEATVLESTVLPDALDGTGRFLIGQNHAIPLDLRLCPRDGDYFSMQANERDVLTVSVLLEGDAGGDVEVRFERDGVPLGVTGRGRNGQLNAFYRVPAGGAGVVTFLVTGAVGQASANYSLTVRRQPSAGGDCSGDPENETGRNDTRATATSVGNTNRAVFENMQLCGEDTPDEDWYQILVPEDDTRISISAQFTHIFGNIDLEMYYENELGRLTESITARNGELIDRSRNLVQAGTYYLRVYNSANQIIDNTYNLTITTVPVLPCPVEERVCPQGGDACPEGDRVCAEDYFCAPDYREGDPDNDDSARPTNLGSGEVQIGDTWICGDTLNIGERGFNVGDWYAIEVPAGRQRTVAVVFAENTDGEINLKAVAPNPDDDAVPQEIIASRSENFACFNIQGGQLPQRVLINAFNLELINDGDQRVDYSMYVLDTDLESTPEGECDLLSPVDNPQPVDALSGQPLANWSLISLP